MNGVHQATNPGALAANPRALTFWPVNALVWTGYAAALMLPWLGRYPVLDMLPNKVAIAATGLAVTGALRVFYGWLASQAVRTSVFVALAFLACVVAAVTFDVTVIALTQGPGSVSLRWDESLGSILGGVPMPGRIGQYTTLLVAWSLGLHLVARRPVAVMNLETASKAETVSESPADAALSVAGSTVRARDGNRTILLDRDEIDWIAADGDYVRIHTGSRSFLVRATMKHSSSALAPLGFARVHRSAIVNPRRVREVIREGSGDHTVVLRSGARIKTGRNYEAQVGALLEGTP